MSHCTHIVYLVDRKQQCTHGVAGDVFLLLTHIDDNAVGLCVEYLLCLGKVYLFDCHIVTSRKNVRFYPVN